MRTNVYKHIVVTQGIWDDFPCFLSFSAIFIAGITGEGGVVPPCITGPVARLIFRDCGAGSRNQLFHAGSR
jgi:hypothetical protein